MKKLILFFEIFIIYKYLYYKGFCVRICEVILMCFVKLLFVWLKNGLVIIKNNMNKMIKKELIKENNKMKIIIIKL